MIRDTDMVLVGQQPWDTEIGCNSKNLALEFSRHNRVLYVNAPLDRISMLRWRQHPRVQHRMSVIRGASKGLELVSPNLWVLYPDCLLESINWIRSHWLFDHFNRINNRRFAGAIRKAMEQLGMQNPILFNDNDLYRSFYLKELLRPAVTVYYSRDNIIATDYWRRHGRQFEPLLIAKSDVCVANSMYLRDYCLQYNPASYYVGQGCDVAHLLAADKECPEELKTLPRPLIGYIGNLTASRLDLELLERLASDHPEWTIVLVGPEDEAFRSSLLHRLPNVLFTGSRPPDRLPAYIQAFDVCINPQTVNPLTVGNYPRKVDEYLAFGKPVVATATRAMEIFEGQVYLIGEGASYTQGITTAMLEDSPHLREERIRFAASHTWENSVRAIYHAIVANAAFLSTQCQPAVATHFE